MKKFLFTAVALCALAVPASAQVKEWKAVAVLDKPAGIYALGAISTGSTEERARAAAATHCEEVTGRTCSPITSSVPVDWFLVISLCNGRGSTGGSAHNEQAANTLAGQEFGLVNGKGCKRVWTFPPGCTSSEHSCAIRGDKTSN